MGSTGKPNIRIGTEPSVDGRRMRLIIGHVSTPEHAIARTDIIIEGEENALECIGQAALEATAVLLEKHRPGSEERVRRIRTALESLNTCPKIAEP